MNKSLKVLFLYNGIFVFASYLLSPLYAIFAEEIVKNVFSVSVTISTFLISTALFTFLISRYGDKVKEKEYLLLTGYLVRSITWFCFIFARNIQWLIVLQFFLGLGESLGTSSYNAIFAEHLDKDKYIKQYASWQLISTIISVVSTLIGGIIVSKFGFTPLFLIMSALAFISSLGILFKPRKLL